jgi:hypothetical protein
MAGTWIKLEAATLDKPELHALAEALKLPPEHVLGLLVRFWLWLDANMRHGRVTHCRYSMVDVVAHYPGFAAEMARVGWLVLDAETGVLTIPNAEFHNGTPAKNRALAAARSSRYRHAKALPTRNAEPSPDKMRLDNIIKSSANTGASNAPTKGTRLANDWKLPRAWGLWAMENRKGWGAAEVRECAAEFFNYWTALPGNRAKKLDWFKTWQNRVSEFMPKQTAGAPTASAKRAATAAAMLNSNHETAEHPRDITGESKRVA